MIFIDNDHILSANRKCLITGHWNSWERALGPMDITGIRAVLSEDGNHIIFDGKRHHSVKEVTFVPSVEWAEAVANDPALFDEAQAALDAHRGYPGVDVQTAHFVQYGGLTLRSNIDRYIAQRVPIT